jgi:hypothetical protein
MRENAFIQKLSFYVNRQAQKLFSYKRAINTNAYNAFKGKIAHSLQN